MAGVFVVDDHELIRRGVAELLETADDLELVGEARSVEEALRRIPAVRPDVALLDLRLPDGNGIELCRELSSSSPDTRCLMLTSFAHEEAVFQSLMAGAVGFVLKDSGSEELMSAIRSAVAGGSQLDPAVAQQVLARIRRGGEGGEPPLTERERELLDLIGEGLTNRQIAERMHLGEKTIKNYVSKLLGKLGMERRAQAAAYAVKRRQRGFRDGTSGAQP